MTANANDSLPTVGPFHVMTKPIGPICNLDCQYCFYLEKEHLYPDKHSFRMRPEVLEAYVRQYIEGQNAGEITFAWQGGEPTLMGVEFFERAVELQKKYANGKRIANAFQTNGTVLNDRWCEFLARNDFLVGLSIDGPRELHDAYRVDKKGRPSFDKVMRGLEFLQKHKVEYNTLTVVNRKNSAQPLEVYRFLKDIGSKFLQFIPIVERLPTREVRAMGLDLNVPPDPEIEVETSPVTDWSVRAKIYGEFLVSIFDEWVRNDVGETYVQFFDVALGNWVGAGGSLCLFSETCGRAMALEHDGNLYACDHYVYPKYELGNIMNTTIAEMVESKQQRKFGTDKRDTLPKYCRECDVRFACHGECPKHRFMKTPDGEDGLNYLCPAYKRIFSHMDPYMKTMAGLLQARQPPAMIMDMIRKKEQAEKLATAGRNEPCPCGSGKKFKQCCGQK